MFSCVDPAPRAPAREVAVGVIGRARVGEGTDRFIGDRGLFFLTFGSAGIDWRDAVIALVERGDHLVGAAVGELGGVGLFGAELGVGAGFGRGGRGCGVAKVLSGPAGAAGRTRGLFVATRR